MTWIVRDAQLPDVPAIMNIIDGALLDVDITRVKHTIEQNCASVADDDGRILGTIIITDQPVTRSKPADSHAYIAAIAVRTNRRNQGIGRGLIDHAQPENVSLVAEFNATSKPFYEALNFTIIQIDADRYTGVLEPST